MTYALIPLAYLLCEQYYHTTPIRFTPKVRCFQSHYPPYCNLQGHNLPVFEIDA